MSHRVMHTPLHGCCSSVSTFSIVSCCMDALTLHSTGAASFISGGLIPAALRGTSNGITCHIADW